MTLDDLRSVHPDLGFALYAIEPRGVVTLEIYDGGQVFPFTGATAEEAIEAAFPSPPPEFLYSPMVLSTPIEPAPAVNVFD